MSAGDAGRKTAGDRPAATTPGKTPAMPSWRDPRLLAAALLLAAAAIGSAWLARPLGTPADLLAVWVAGEFWQMGRLGEIYPPADGLFTMLPPSGWIDWLATQEGYTDSVYPFLYPPLWAVVMGTLAPSNFGPVAEISYWINAALLAAMVMLAIRASGALLHPVIHVLLVLLVFFETFIASVGFLQGQPHILVAFLIVLAVERSRAGSGVAAGAALALAASIKLFPALYAVIWIARGDMRPLLAFAVVGLGLAASSILLAGWPLHRAFLDSVVQIGQTLLVTRFNVSFDAVVAQLFTPEAVEVVRIATEDGLSTSAGGWRVAPRPWLWAVLGNAALVSVLAGAALAARRVPPAALYAGLWPLLLTLSVVFTPTGWVYYVIPAAVFAPAMVAILPNGRGGAVFLSGLALFYAGRFTMNWDFPSLPTIEALVYVAGMLVWSLGFGRVVLELARD